MYFRRRLAIYNTQSAHPRYDLKYFGAAHSSDGATKYARLHARYLFIATASGAS